MRPIFVLFCLTWLWSIPNVYASDDPNMTIIGDWQVHHIAFPSTFIQPEVAKATGFDRRNNYNLINISVVDKTSKQPLALKVTGYAQNLIGHRKNLTFKKIDEGDAIYYLAEIRHANEETYRFFIQLSEPTSGRSETLEFMQKMWVD
ncbi:DUF4426 domain-containing protein [Gayadomonas joobiniege]|uniref:DUF4426 domain-containing protein n=1 Tax=Gayadomonas joobiniege TaxID=1234606 RepID=UPI00037D58B7|nr:DUF4426 domain-containing protein [Gayadomonas joobiniege]